MKAQPKLVMVLCLFALGANKVCAQAITTATAQTASTTLNKAKIYSITFAQSSDNKFTQGEPGKFVGTLPYDTAKSAFLINGYLGLNFNIGSRFQLSTTAELQRNSLIKKKQHVQQYGLKLAKAIVLKKSFENGFDVQKTIWVSELSAKYSADKIKAEEGAQFIFSNSFSFPTPWNNFNFLRPNVMHPADDGSEKAKWLQFRHTHNIGVEYIAYKKLALVNATFGLELYPLSGHLYNVFQKYDLILLKASIVDRFKLSKNNSSLYVGPLITLGAALNIKLDKDKEGTNVVTIGYDFIHGGDPLKGLEDQRYGQIAIGAKVSL